MELRFCAEEVIYQWSVLLAKNILTLENDLIRDKMQRCENKSTPLHVLERSGLSLVPRKCYPVAVIHHCLSSLPVRWVCRSYLPSLGHRTRLWAAGLWFELRWSNPLAIFEPLHTPTFHTHRSWEGSKEKVSFHRSIERKIGSNGLFNYIYLFMPGFGSYP